MKNFEIWESDYNQNTDRGGILIPSHEIKQMIDLANISICSIADLSVVEIDKLNEKLKLWNPLHDEEDLRIFLADEGFTFGSINLLNNSESPEEIVCFDFHNKSFDDLNYLKLLLGINGMTEAIIKKNGQEKTLPLQRYQYQMKNTLIWTSMMVMGIGVLVVISFTMRLSIK